MVKIELYLPHEELVDGMSRRPSSSVHRALTWRRRTPTATAKKTMSTAGVMTASVRSRQPSALLPASSRASGGARVHARVEEEIMTTVRCVFIGTGAALRYYTGAPGDSHLRNTWPLCGILGFVPCPTHAWIVGWSFPLLRVSGGGISIKSGLNVCLCIFC